MNRPHRSLAEISRSEVADQGEGKTDRTQPYFECSGRIAPTRRALWEVQGRSVRTKSVPTASLLSDLAARRPPPARRAFALGLSRHLLSRSLSLLFFHRFGASFAASSAFSFPLHDSSACQTFIMDPVKRARLSAILDEVTSEEMIASNVSSCAPSEPACTFAAF